MVWIVQPVPILEWTRLLNVLQDFSKSFRSSLEGKLLSLQTAGHIYSFGQNQDSEVTHQEPVCPRDLSTLLVKSLFRKEILGEESSRHPSLL